MPFDQARIVDDNFRRIAQWVPPLIRRRKNTRVGASHCIRFTQKDCKRLQAKDYDILRESV